MRLGVGDEGGYGSRTLLYGGNELLGQTNSTCKTSPLVLPLSGFSFWGVLHLPGFMVFSLFLNYCVSSKFHISPFASLPSLPSSGGFLVTSVLFFSLWDVY